MKILPYKIYSNTQKNTSPLKASLFIAFYNNFDFLEKVLASVEKQTSKEYEVVICDDGSRPDIVERIHQYMRLSKLPMLHLWHSDDGFRKNEMLNKAIKNCRSDYIIFIDQDCVLHPKFVEEHLNNKSQNTILAGRRLEFSPWISNLLSADKIRSGFIEKNLWWIIPAISHRKDNQGPKGLYTENLFLRKFLNRKKRGVVGCNFSVHKQDLLSVNGFDVRYQGPGTGEDSDIEWRLNQVGVKTQTVFNMAVQYHLFHKLQKRKNENEKLFKEIQAKNETHTQFGMNLIPEGEKVSL